MHPSDQRPATREGVTFCIRKLGLLGHPAGQLIRYVPFSGLSLKWHDADTEPARDGKG